MFGRIHRLFVSKTTTETTVERRPMTAEERAAFDELFATMNEGFDAFSRVFDKKRKGSSHE